MARIPRNERFVDFQPSAPVLTPLSLGDTSGFANALMGGAKTVAQEHTNRKNAEDEVALRKFNQNLLNHESEALTSLENTPTVDGVALPHRDYRQFTEENFEEFKEKFEKENGGRLVYIADMCFFNLVVPLAGYAPAADHYQ